MAVLNQAYANQYGANIYRMAQQTGSVLRKFMRVEPGTIILIEKR